MFIRQKLTATKRKQLVIENKMFNVMANDEQANNERKGRSATTRSHSFGFTYSRAPRGARCIYIARSVRNKALRLCALLVQSQICTPLQSCMYPSNSFPSLMPLPWSKYILADVSTTILFNYSLMQSQGCGVGLQYPS